MKSGILSTAMARPRKVKPDPLFGISQNERASLILSDHCGQKPDPTMELNLR
jgi:hypothetical protein